MRSRSDGISCVLCNTCFDGINNSSCLSCSAKVAIKASMRIEFTLTSAVTFCLLLRGMMIKWTVLLGVDLRD